MYMCKTVQLPHGYSCNTTCTQDSIVTTVSACQVSDISVSVNGSEDGEIFCLKDSGVAVLSRAEKRTLLQLALKDVPNDADPFCNLNLSSDEEQ